MQRVGHGGRVCVFQMCVGLILSWRSRKNTENRAFVRRHLKATDNIIFNAKMPNLHWHFNELSLPTLLFFCCWCHRGPLNYQIGAGGEKKTQKNSFSSTGLSLSQGHRSARSSEVEKKGSVGVREIKLTGNSSVNETDKRTNHVLSKMSPKVI